LCCDGTIFARVRLTSDEAAWASKRRLPMIETESGARMTLPCTLFSDRCTAYDERPRACREFRCTLLEGVEDGQLPLETAIARVRDVKRRFAALEARRGTRDERSVEAMLEEGALRAALRREFGVSWEDTRDES
jgi:hypothetical protein